MTDRELMQQALDALNNSVDLVREDAYNAEKLYGNYPTRQGKVGGLKVLADDHEKAITALRDRLAQPEQGLVAWEQFHEHMAGPFYKAPRELTDVEIHQQTIDALRGKVEQLKPKRPWAGLTDEPMAWMFQHEETGHTMCVDAQQLELGFEKGNPRLKKIAPLYTNPPQRQWVGLTDEELIELSESGLHLWGLWRAIEAKLKEKNT